MKTKFRRAIYFSARAIDETSELDTVTVLCSMPRCAHVCNPFTYVIQNLWMPLSSDFRECALHSNNDNL